MTKINTIKALKNVIEASESTLYVRWSRGFSKDAKQGKSKDYAFGGCHAGLSAIEVDPDWIEDETYLARRITEYWFLKMKDEKISCHIYTGEEVGKDSDGYESINNIGHVASLSNKLINELVEIKSK